MTTFGWRCLLAFLIGLTLMMALPRARAETPDEIRARALLQTAKDVVQDTKVPSDHGTSVQVKQEERYFWNLAFRPPGQTVVFLSGHASAGRCEQSRKLVQLQLTRFGWGRAACLRQLQP